MGTWKSGHQRAAATRGEKARQQTAALLCQHTTNSYGVVIEARFGEQVDHAAGRARLGVPRAEHNAIDACMQDRANTHGAGFQRYVQRTTRQAVIAQAGSGIAQRHDLGMGGGIVPADRLIEAATDNITVPHDHGTYRHFTGCTSLACQIKRQPHESAIVHGADYGITTAFRYTGRVNALGVFGNRAASFHQLRLRRSQSRNRHAWPRTGDIGEADAVAKMDGRRMAAMLTADAYLEVRPGFASFNHGQFHQFADPLLVQHLERVVLENSGFDIGWQKFVLRVFATE